MTDLEADVPYGEDFHDPAVAAAWAAGVQQTVPDFLAPTAPGNRLDIIRGLAKTKP